MMRQPGQRQLKQRLEECVTEEVGAERDLWPSIYNQLLKQAEGSPVYQQIQDNQKQTRRVVMAGLVLGLVVALVVGLLGLSLLRVSTDQKVALAPTSVSSTAVVAAATSPTSAPPPATPKSGLGFSLVIYGLRTYHPDRAGEKIVLSLINEGEVTLSLSQFCAVKLQSQGEGNEWETIAFGRPCPSESESMLSRVHSGSSVDLSFEFGKTVPLKGQSWLVPGVYRLEVTYYLGCDKQPSTATKVGDCSNPPQYAYSDSFEIMPDKLPVAKVADLNNRAVELRKEPEVPLSGEASNVIAVIQMGEEVELMGRPKTEQDGNKWLPVRYKGQEGWLMGGLPIFN